MAIIPFDEMQTHPLPNQSTSSNRKLVVGLTTVTMQTKKIQHRTTEYAPITISESDNPSSSESESDGLDGEADFDIDSHHGCHIADVEDEQDADDDEGENEPGINLPKEALTAGADSEPVLRVTKRKHTTGNDDTVRATLPHSQRALSVRSC